MQTRSSGGIVVNSTGQVVLVLERDFNGWVLPKGHIKQDETPEQAARREIYEETGLSLINLIKPLGLIEREEFGTGKTKIIHCFLFKCESRMVCAGAEWFDITTAKQKLYFAQEKQFLETNEQEIRNCLKSP